MKEYRGYTYDVSPAAHSDTFVYQVAGQKPGLALSAEEADRKARQKIDDLVNDNVLDLLSLAVEIRLALTKGDDPTLMALETRVMGWAASMGDALDTIRGNKDQQVRKAVRKAVGYTRP